MFLKYQKTRAHRPQGQVAALFIVLLAVLIVFMAVTLNVGRLANRKTTMDNAVDGAALGFASTLGSYSSVRAITKGCSTDVTSILGVFVGIAVFFANPFAGIAIIGATYGRMQFNNYMAAKGIRKMRSLSEETQMRETAINYALNYIIDNPNQVIDINDLDEDGDTNDRVPEFATWYDSRLDYLDTGKLDSLPIGADNPARKTALCNARARLNELQCTITGVSDFDLTVAADSAIVNDCQSLGVSFSELPCSQAPDGFKGDIDLDDGNESAGFSSDFNGYIETDFILLLNGLRNLYLSDPELYGFIGPQILKELGGFWKDNPAGTPCELVKDSVTNPDPDTFTPADITDPAEVCDYFDVFRTQLGTLLEVVGVIEQTVKNGGNLWSRVDTLFSMAYTPVDPAECDSYAANCDVFCQNIADAKCEDICIADANTNYFDDCRNEAASLCAGSGLEIYNCPNYESYYYTCIESYASICKTSNAAYISCYNTGRNVCLDGCTNPSGIFCNNLRGSMDTWKAWVLDWKERLEVIRDAQTVVTATGTNFDIFPEPGQCSTICNNLCNNVFPNIWQMSGGNCNSMGSIIFPRFDAFDLCTDCTLNADNFCQCTYNCTFHMDMSIAQNCVYPEQWGLPGPGCCCSLGMCQLSCLTGAISGLNQCYYDCREPGDCSFAADPVNCREYVEACGDGYTCANGYDCYNDCFNGCFKPQVNNCCFNTCYNSCYLPIEQDIDQAIDMLSAFHDRIDELTSRLDAARSAYEAIKAMGEVFELEHKAVYGWKDKLGWHIVKVQASDITLPSLSYHSEDWGFTDCIDLDCECGEVGVWAWRYDQKHTADFTGRANLPIWDFRYGRTADCAVEEPAFMSDDAYNSWDDVLSMGGIAQVNAAEQLVTACGMRAHSRASFGSDLYQVKLIKTQWDTSAPRQCVACP